MPSITIEEEMRRSYLDYAMSVIVSRALPDVRDGLKPVHRRILHSMNENGYTHDKAYRKSARIVGEVLGKYHPHGDQSVYDAMVRMAQDFSLRLPLIDGQGNFGSMDNDPPAAMRYTEARLALSAEALLDDIDNDTVDFVANYDGQEREPVVLPARFPNLLVNGAGGIAVGMATNIPPHNLGEIIDACCAYVDDPGVTDDRLIELVPAPDFPTGGIILGRSGANSAARTGRGSVIIRGKVHFEEIRKDRRAIVITEIPFQVNKAGMVEKISDLHRAKRVEGIAELRDESDRHGIRVVVELKRDAVPEVVLNQLYKFSPLQTSFGVNALALNGGRPMQMTLKEMIAAFVEFRAEVITRRTRFLLRKARDRAHVLVGLAIAVANIDQVIALIRAAPDTGTARQQLMERDWPAADVEPLIELIADPGYAVVDGKYRLSEVQARAILDLRLARLTALGRDEIGDELKGLAADIIDYLETLRNHSKLMGILRAELVDAREKFATPRRTAIEESEFDFEDEDLIAPEDMVVTVTNAGYVKRVPLSTYRAQNRGGKGRSGMSTRDEDFVTQLFVVNTHTPLLIFTANGRVFKLKVWKLPVGTPQSRGRPLINLVPLDEGEGVATIMPLPEDETTWGSLNVMFVTSRGSVRRNTLDDFSNVMSNGKIAMKLEDGNRLVAVAACTPDDDVLLSARFGKCIRFPVDEVRVFAGRSSEGVRGMRLAEGDEVISMSILHHNEITVEERDNFLRARRREEGAPLEGITQERVAELESQEQFILSITEKGYGKRTSAYEYRISGRDGQGIIDIDTSERNGTVVASFPVADTDEIMLTSNGGQLIRMGVHDIRVTGRASQGVTLFKVAEGEKVMSVARLADVEQDEDSQQDDEPAGDDGPADESPGEAE
ncbi:DNA gyrase subunit A [Iodidimonas sp. SYSU 1G8]|uniref:DNA gyrase subunit A n=1 Tax=Iodidimonas sp. SYSU 1G8 TaxID=3133967 RepID=UPI0031FF1C51